MPDREQDWRQVAARMWFTEHKTPRQIADTTEQSLETVQAHLADVTGRLVRGIYRQRFQAGGF